VGILLGESHNGQYDMTNSYAVPFEEDAKDPTVWFLDHNYHEEMYTMFKKINAKEKVLGWYSTGPKIRPADLAVHELVRRYCAKPVFVVIDVDPKDDLEGGPIAGVVRVLLDVQFASR
jgi:26S proteasome regulatory subunit N8